jgi:sugar-specific transcriptional regulator TrmB
VASQGASTNLATLRSWSFITHHAQVLLTVARHPDASVAGLAKAAQISERSTYRVLADLQKAGYVLRRKTGRENRYEVNEALALRDPIVEDQLVRDLLRLGGDQEVAVHLIRLPRGA